jgi:nucleotide-binding universal stress UspA family protein
MKTINISKILVPIDFSATSLLAFEHAVSLAKHFNAKLFLLHVIEHNLFMHNIFLPETKVVDFGNISNIAENKLNELIANLGNDSGIEAVSMVQEGKVTSSVVRAADLVEADLIVMGTHGSSGIEEFFVGSNAERVVVNAHCPVLTIHDEATVPGFRKILLPIDSSSASRQKLAHAVFIAKNYNATINVLGLLTDEDDSEHVKIFNLKIEQVNEFLEKNNIPHTTEIVPSSNHSKRIIKYAEDNASDLIIIMTEQEMDGPGIFLGVEAQRIVNHSIIPVLSVSPEGFSIAGTRNNPI